jgi:uncharacterized protein YcfJ
MVAAGVVVGAIVETDCASVSIGDRTPRRSPYAEVVPGVSIVDTITPVVCEWTVVYTRAKTVTESSAIHNGSWDTMPHSPN